MADKAPKDEDKKQVASKEPNVAAASDNQSNETDMPSELKVKDSTKDSLLDEDPAPAQDKQIDEEKHADTPPSDDELGDAMEKAETETGAPGPKQPSRHSRKKLVLITSGVIVVLIAVLFAVPATRYAIAGLVMKRDVVVMLQDSKTHKPVSQVALTLGGKQSTTDNKGKATFKSVPVGDTQLTAKKKYYKDLGADVLVPIFGNVPSPELSIEATGRQVPIKVTNKVSGKVVEGAEVSADGTSSKTDKNGEAVLVLSAAKATEKATVALGGYNNAEIDVTVTDQQDDKNTFGIVPSGKLYFLSKRTGTINVMKSDLDGGNVQTVLAGTGKEEDRETVLLASRDWKYLALRSRRDSDKPKLYLINTSTDRMTLIDEGDAAFDAVGWSGHYFVYKVYRDNVKSWEPKQAALKSFNASNSNLNVLDEATASGESIYKLAREDIGTAYILENEVVFTKSWYANGMSLDGKSNTINSVRPDGSNKHAIKSFSATNDRIGAQAYKPQELYVRVEHADSTPSTYWEYEDGHLTESKDLTSNDFAKFYPTYLLSPSGKNTFWYEPRDGKNALFVGDKDGGAAKQLATSSEYTPYGWYTDDYLLVSKGGSELYVMARSTPDKLLKVTDYHKPFVNFSGYGYGYGGL